MTICNLIINKPTGSVSCILPPGHSGPCVPGPSITGNGITDLETRVAKAIMATDANWSIGIKENPYVSQARAAITAVFEWQPIETAPKDGTPIFVYREHCGWEYFVVHWVNDRFFTLDSDLNPFSPIFGPPTHWMPLPLPPSPKPDKKPDNQ